MANEQSKKTGIGYWGVIQDLRTLIHEQMKKEDIPGLAIAMVEGQNLVWAEGFGFTDRTKKQRVTANTPFSLQSAGKTYTATGYLIAASRGQVRLDDPLRKYYPEFRVNSRYGDDELNKITFRHLLSHWSGLCHEAPVGNNYDTPPCTFDEHIQSIADTWLRFPVGQRWSYSNLGMDLVAYTLQLVYGKSFSEYMREELLMPLGMTHSTYDQRFMFSNWAYARGHRGPFEAPVPLIPMLGAGGLFASALDVAKFLSFHLAGGVLDGQTLIDENLLNEMYQLQFPVKNQVCGYGLGILIDQQFGTMLLTHPGGGYGYQAIQSWIPEYSVGVAVFMNIGGNLHLKVHDMALKGMIAAKYGSVPDHQPLPFANWPVIPVEVDLLRRLQGNYRGRDTTVTIRENAGMLTMDDSQVLRPYSPTGFTTKDGIQVTFSLDAQERSVEMQILDRWGYHRYSIDHTLSDDPGSNKSEWIAFTGIYSVSESSIVYYAAVNIKNGYLNITGWMGEVRLREYGPTLFFTVDGEAVIFYEDAMSYGNAYHVRETDPYHQVVELAETHPDDRKLTEDTLARLGNAYMSMKEQEKAIAVLKLNVQLHSKSVTALLPLIQAYQEIGDTLNAEKYHRQALSIDPSNKAVLKISMRKS